MCRDLGLPWTEAALLPRGSLPPADPEQPIHFDNVQCAGGWLGAAAGCGAGGPRQGLVGGACVPYVGLPACRGFDAHVIRSVDCPVV